MPEYEIHTETDEPPEVVQGAGHQYRAVPEGVPEAEQHVVFEVYDEDERTVFETPFFHVTKTLIDHE